MWYYIIQRQEKASDEWTHYLNVRDNRLENEAKMLQKALAKQTKEEKAEFDALRQRVAEMRAAAQA